MKIKTFLTLILGTTLMHAAETAIDPKGQNTVKNEVFSSMIGYRNTLLFYTFAAEKAVLQVSVDNKTDKFPMIGKLHVFAKETTAEDLANWINNQHSCGLFPDVPEPILSHNLPAESYSVVSKKTVELVEGQGPSSGGKFNRYQVEFNQVEFKIENVPAHGTIRIKDFTDTATVFVNIDGEG